MSRSICSSRELPGGPPCWAACCAAPAGTMAVDAEAPAAAAAEEEEDGAADEEREDPASVDARLGAAESEDDMVGVWFCALLQDGWMAGSKVRKAKLAAS